MKYSRKYPQASTKPGLSPDTLNNQNNLGVAWEAKNWSGVCDDLAKIDKPLLVITGTDDNQYQPHQNALVIASKVPGAWLVQIKDAGHAVPDQYPEEVSNIIETFLSTVKEWETKRKEESDINFVHNIDKRVQINHKKVRSAGFEPAIPSLGSSYLNQAGPTSPEIKLTKRY